MSCIKDSCNFSKNTKDGYCKHHKILSKDEKIIIVFISRFLTDIENTNGRINKLNMIIKLIKYLNNNIEYIIKKKFFKKAVINKFNNMIIEIKSYENIDYNKKEQFINITNNLLINL